MILDFDYVYDKYNLNISGLLHIGGHYGGELQKYKSHNIDNIVLFEPLSSNFSVLSEALKNIGGNITAHQVALGNDNRKVTMNISSNDAQSSSILTPKVHLTAHPEVSFSGTEEVEMKKLDDYDYKDYNMIVVDVQGYELEVLKGASRTLHNIDYIYCEVNRDEVYEGNARVEEIDDFLSTYRFKRVETLWYYTEVWGDALYVKEKKSIPNYYAHKIMKTNKLENFPSVYYVSLEESTDRQKNLEKQFAEYGITPTAIISKRYSESDDEITGKFLDQMNGGTIGCAVSHLKAIRKWYEETDEEYAFFCEDDLSLETIQYWDFTWGEFIETIPEGSLYVQLLLIRDNYETFEIRKKLWDDWAATAYILTREYAKLLVDSYCLGEKKFHLEIPGVNNYAVPLVENILFETVDKGGAAVPLFVEDVNFGTTFSPEEDNEVVNNQKGGHYKARETVLNYWKNKNKMKSFKITKQEEPKDFKMNQIEYLLSEYANDCENAENNLKLGAWYWNQKHSAPALSYFLRCAERAEDPTLAYEALLWSHLCYEIQGTRDATARTLLQQAVHELPNRPEAYYLLAKFHSKREQWTDAYIAATQGLTLTEKDLPPLRNDIGYVGEYAFLYEKAVSGWWWGKSEESREILQYIQYNYDLNDNYHNIVSQKLNEYGEKKITEKQNKKISDIFEIEYLNACNTPSDINENLHILYDIAKECGHVTEMGVRTGCSTRAFLNTDVILRSYDLEKDEIVSNLFDYAKKIGKDVEYFEANVLDIEIEETDLLFIDTWHQYEQLDQELNKHSNKVRKYIAFHDTHTYALNGEKCSNTSSGNILTDFKENPYGILPCIIEFTIKNPEWKFKVYKTNNNGMTILEKKKYIMPIPVIGVPIVNGFHWLQRLVDSIDYPVKELCIINNNGRGELDEDLERLSKTSHKFIEKIKVCNLPSNIGCSGAWNLIIKTHIMEPYWIIVNNDIAFSPGLLKELVEKSKDENVGIVKGKEFQWDLFLIKDLVVQECGLFDENFYPAYVEDCDYHIRLMNKNIKTEIIECEYLHGDVNYETTGSQTWRIDLSLKEKLVHAHQCNLYYIAEKWGPSWRDLNWDFNPWKHPYNNPQIPNTYTTYDLKFIRRKHLGF